MKQDSLKEEEKLKKELRLRLAMAGFLQETVTEMAVKRKTRYHPSFSSLASAVLFFLAVLKSKSHRVSQLVSLFYALLSLDVQIGHLQRTQVKLLLALGAFLYSVLHGSSCFVNHASVIEATLSYRSCPLNVL